MENVKRKGLTFRLDRERKIWLEKQKERERKRQNEIYVKREREEGRDKVRKRDM